MGSFFAKKFYIFSRFAPPLRGFWSFTHDMSSQTSLWRKNLHTHRHEKVPKILAGAALQWNTDFKNHQHLFGDRLNDHKVTKKDASRQKPQKNDKKRELPVGLLNWPPIKIFPL